MSTDIEKQKTFEERMKSRIRDSIGELMTDEELSKIVNRVTEEVFFKPIKLGEGYQMKEHPPFIHVIIKELLTDSVRDLIKEYFEQNKTGITETIRQVIKEGLGSAVLSAINNQFQQSMFSFEQNIINQIQNQ